MKITMAALALMLAAGGVSAQETSAPAAPEQTQPDTGVQQTLTEPEPEKATTDDQDKSRRERRRDDRGGKEGGEEGVEGKQGSTEPAGGTDAQPGTPETGTQPGTSTPEQPGTNPQP